MRAFDEIQSAIDALTRVGVQELADRYTPGRVAAAMRELGAPERSGDASANIISVADGTRLTILIARRTIWHSC